MKRAIIPISIHSENILISTIEELDSIESSNNELYMALHLSGDVDRMYYSYSKIAPTVKEKNIDINKTSYLCSSRDPLAEQGKIKLLAKKYVSESETIDSNLKIYGMHKHKTLLDFSSKTIIIHGNLSLSYMSVRNANFIIFPNAKLRLSNSMLDSVHIEARNNSILDLQDVEFSNNETDCIYLRDGATISLFDDVRFFDTRTRYKIEKATLETTGRLFDFTSTVSILNFLDTSDVDVIELIGDFTHNGKEIVLKQAIEFTNGTNEELSVRIGKLIISENINFNGNFNVSANIFVEESVDTKISLANFYGKLEARECDNLNIHNTKIGKQVNGGFDLKSCSAIVSSCTFEEVERPIKMSNTKIMLESISATSVDELIDIYRYEKSEDELYIEKMLDKNIINISISKFNSSKIIKTKLLEKIVINKSTFENNNNCFDMHECAEFFIADSEVRNTNNFMELKNSSAYIDSVKFDHGAQAIIVENSKVEIKKSKFTRHSSAIQNNHGLVNISYSVLQDNEVGITLEGEKASLEYYKCDFSGNRARAIMKKPGCSVVDLEEIEEDVKCQLA